MRLKKPWSKPVFKKLKPKRWWRMLGLLFKMLENKPKMTKLKHLMLSKLLKKPKNSKWKSRLKPKEEWRRQSKLKLRLKFK
jgi:hypothetical protein